MSFALIAALLATGAAPLEARRFEPLELAFPADEPAANPFTDVSLAATFTHESGRVVVCDGFFDGNGAGGQDGNVFRVRFAPPDAGRWEYRTRANLASLNGRTGAIDCLPAIGPGPVVVSKKSPRHFEFAGSGKPYYPLGTTAYHLLSPANDDEAIVAALDAWRRRGFNRLRVLLSGYPRDDDSPDAASSARRHPDLWQRPNYGAPADSVLALPAWLGRPHAYDFSRFDLAYWHKVERAVRAARERGLVVCGIFTIEKQDLPGELGAGSDAEKLFYRYAVSRLAAFDNVWWDLGNEHNEFRDGAWGEAMGQFVKKVDPYDRPLSAHAYAEWRYGDAAWADFIITQQYGDPAQVNAWALKHREVNKPYINEEYGYEGRLEKWDHLQNGDLTRQTHWAIALAGGYATYGSWDDDASFYSGRPACGPGGEQLRHLLAFFASVPFARLDPDNDRLPGGFCLTDGQSVLAGYLPAIPANDPLDSIAPNFSGLPESCELKWFNPRDGEWTDPIAIRPGIKIARPSSEDWALVIRQAEGTR